MVDEWLSIGQIAKQTKMAETTLRRYATIFKEYLEADERGRAVKYSTEAQELFIQISSLYEAGYSTPEIENNLKGQYPQTLDITTTDDSGGLVAVSTIIEVIKKQQNEIEELRDELNEIKDHIAVGLEERDKKLVETMRKMIEEKKKPWWKKLIGFK